MIFNKKFKTWKNDDDKILFLKKYKIIPKASNNIKTLYYKGKSVTSPTKCEIIGYEEEFSNSCTLVIDYGKGPCFILSDFLNEMQKKDF